MELKLETEGTRLRATFGGDGPVPRATCDELVAAIEQRAPRSVQILCDFGMPGDAWPEALAGRALPSVEALIFDTYFQTQTRQGANSIGDLHATLAACPNLERVFATGALALSPVEHGKLRALHLLGDPLSPALLAALGKSRFERLERLVLSLASDGGPGDGVAAIAALHDVRAPALREVTLHGGGSVEELVALIAGAPRPWHFVLDGAIDDEDALLEVLKRHALALSTLGSLGIPFADYTSTDAFDRALSLVPTITDSSEHDPGTEPATYASW